MRAHSSGATDRHIGRRRLLRVAALAAPDVAREAWRAWSTDADPWRFDPASQWWLPLVWWNLRSALGDSSERTALRHEYSQAWIRNQHLLSRVSPMLEALHHAGIQTLLLKGAALALGTYERPGLRPFGDVDVLVRPDAAASARQILERQGWVPIRRLAPSKLAAVHSLGYTDSQGVDFDLHWHALAECCATGVDDRFWDRSVPLDAGGVQTRGLCPSDQLLHICTHGGRATRVPTGHWMADATTILRRWDGSIAWDTFISEARRRCLTFQLRRAMSALEPDYAGVPSAAMDELEGTRAQWWERAEHRAKRSLAPPSLALQLWCIEARNRISAPDRSIGFLARLRAAAESDTHGQLAGRMTLAALGLGRRGATHVFDAYGRRIQIETEPGVDMRDVRRALDDRLPRLSRSRSSGPPDRVYQFLRVEPSAATAPTYRVLVNSGPPAGGSTLADVADYVATDLQSFLALATADRTFIHAGVVCLQGRAIVLPGESGSGKSTLVAALLRAGATYSSDEFAVIDKSGQVHPYSRPLKLRHTGAADEHVRPNQWGVRTSTRALPARLILFTAFRPDGQFNPQQLSASASMLRLLNHCPGAQGRPAQTMAALRALVQTAPSWAADRPDTDTVVRALLEGELGR